jgi:hypothetical protein
MKIYIFMKIEIVSIFCYVLMLLTFVGPHSPLAQSGRGTITVCKSSHAIRNLHTLLNFMGSPVRYSRGVTAFAKMSSSRAPALGAWTRNATIFPTTDCETKISSISSYTSYLKHYTTCNK